MNKLEVDTKKILDKQLLTENEINKIKHRLDNKKIDLTIGIGIWHNYDITKEQTQKGIEWLRKQLTVGNNKRKADITKQLSFIEKDIINDFKCFQFVWFESENNGYTTKYYPIYRVWSNHKEHFDYYYNTKRIEVI